MQNARIISLAGFGLLALVPFLGGGAAGIGHVHIANFAFNPTPATVVVGDTVEWDQHDAGALHTATDNNCPRAGGPGPCEFDSNPAGGGMPQGQFFSHTFAATGTFNYKCTIHGFLGKITVVPATGGPDLVVDAVTINAGGLPFEKRVDVTVRNQGDTASGASTASASYLYKNVFNTIGTAPVAGLAPGATQTVSMTWNVLTKLGDFRVKGTADSALAVPEISEHNNDNFATASILVGGQPGRDLTNP
jgi:plastocyanin